MKKNLWFLIVTILIPTVVWAAPVYKYTDSSGKVVYSSKPKNPDDKPVELPNIMKGDPKQPDPELQTCKSHGGINCIAGMDADGSVICSDGFKDAVSRFRFSCTAPKLEINEISLNKKPGSFKVVVRNTSSVEAKGVSVKFKPEIGGTFLLIGGSSIAGYESGEYTYNPADEFHYFTRVDPGQINVLCLNCP